MFLIISVFKTFYDNNKLYQFTFYKTLVCIIKTSKKSIETFTPTLGWCRLLVILRIAIICVVLLLWTNCARLCLKVITGIFYESIIASFVETRNNLLSVHNTLATEMFFDIAVLVVPETLLNNFRPKCADKNILFFLKAFRSKFIETRGRDTRKRNNPVLNRTYGSI